MLDALLFFGYFAAVPLLHVGLVRRLVPPIRSGKLNPYAAFLIHGVAMVVMIVGASIPATARRMHLEGGLDVGSAATLSFSLLVNTASAAACVLYAAWHFRSAAQGAR